MSFVTTDFPKNSNIVIIAGRGEYPVICAKSIEKSGHKVSVVAVDDDVDETWLNSLPKEQVAKVSVGQISRFLKALKKFDASYTIMAGQIKPKKLFHGMIPDLKALTMLAKLKEHNAESIFGAISSEIESIGVKILDARSFMGHELATFGEMSCKNSAINNESLGFGIGIAREVARLNIGQSVVVRKGTVVAVEDFAGTDDLIKRVANFHLKDAIFIKTAKFNQDFRFDVPVFGIQTLENLNNSGIKFAALEANNVILLNKKDVLAKAEKYGISLIGF